MKTIGTDQLLNMKFERHPLSHRWQPHLGRVPMAFMGIVYGESGEGKSEYCVQLAKEFGRFARVEWVGYETGHAASIQDAAERNGMKMVDIGWSDPWQLKPQKSPCLLSYPKHKHAHVNQLFEDLVIKIAKKKSARYWFIDSLDATKFTEDQVLWLWKCFGRKKVIIWISHPKGRNPKSAAGKAVEFYGDIGVYVKHYIAYPDKSRYGGKEPLVIWEEEARLRNPLFFELPGKVVKPIKKRKK